MGLLQLVHAWPQLVVHGRAQLTVPFSHISACKAVARDTASSM
jgi:hypothetical protein